MEIQRKAIIIGAGVAGLAAAVRLTMQGYVVSVFEKNSLPGGKLQEISGNGYHFDAGPSLFTQPENLRELFSLAGVELDDYLQYSSLENTCKYFYEDGTVINAFSNHELFAAELAAKTNDTGRALTTYLERSGKLYKRIGEVFLNYSLHKKSALRKAPWWRAIKATRWPLVFRTLHQLNTKAFKDPKTIQLFNRYATYNGSNPYQAPGMLSLIPHLEHNEGSFYPRGGMISITHALYRLAKEKGVSFHFDQPVQRIIYSDQKVMGVVANDTNIFADIVVSNMDVYFTHRYLLRDEVKARSLLKQERSSSAMIFYWGMATDHPALDLHNIFFSRDYRREFDHLFVQKKIDEDPTIYINVTARQEPGEHAPHGHANWFVMINVPANTGQDWENDRIIARKNIIAKLNRLLQMDIESQIRFEQVADPVTIEAGTSSYMGSLYGTSSNSKMAAFFRHPNFSKKIKGLYFAGGSAHPGGGIPLCLKSAKIMGELVAADDSKNAKRPH